MAPAPLEFAISDNKLAIDNKPQVKIAILALIGLQGV